MNIRSDPPPDMTPAKTVTPQRLIRQYRTALLAFLADNSEQRLIAGYELARVALEAGISFADVTMAHFETLAQIARPEHRLDDVDDLAARFWLEFASVYDMALKGYRNVIPLLRQEISERKQAERHLRAATVELAQERDRLDARVMERTRELQLKADALELALVRLRQTNRQQAEFTYAISHDLKSPNTTMAMLIAELGLACGDGISAEAREMLDLMQFTSARMARLVEDVLTYSRCVDAPPPFGPVALDLVLADVAADLRQEIDSAGAELRFPLLPVVIGDPTQLRLLVRNLIMNAIKFRQPGRPAVITVGVEAQDQLWQLLSISDNGIGIAPEYLERIFGLFQRLHGDDCYEGSGIGLALCTRIASNFDSEIKVSSRLGIGSTFSVALKRHLP